MKIFFSALFVCAGVAAYAGDVANPSCAWTMEGLSCDSSAVAAAPEIKAGRNRV